MRLLVTGACGFVGTTIIRSWLEAEPGLQIWGIDSFIRPGSEGNRTEVQGLGVCLRHGDIRMPSDFEALPAVDWVIDAAANPSVLAGIDGRTGSRQLVEHNLLGTVNILEYCRRVGAGFILLSTSRVFSIPPLAGAAVERVGNSFRLRSGQPLPVGLSLAGVSEEFSTAPPVSLYGSTKLASEVLALEYGETFGFPVWIDRCGVLAGAGQFGRADQGIFAYWINSWLRRQPLAYIGFGGEGHQVRDCFHPRDLVSLMKRQVASPSSPAARVLNLGGGVDRAMSLAQLSEWCAGRFGPHTVARRDEPRRFDVPWLVMDGAKAKEMWGWQPLTPLDDILEEIARHAERHPDWLERSADR